MYVLSTSCTDKMGKADKSWIFFVYLRGSYSELIDTGASTGGSGRNLRPNWAHGGENYTLKGDEFLQIYGSYVIYKSFFLHDSHLQLGVRTSLMFVHHCTPI